MDLVPLLWPFGCYRISEIYKKWFSKSIEIQTNYGPIVGYTIASHFGYTYNCFLSVPYGKPPIGELRFKDPEPIEPWTEPLSTIHEMLACQLNVLLKIPQGTEDCLRMNIFTKTINNDGNNKLPVLVYFHGGAFIFGSNTKDVFNPEFLLRKDVIVIVVNYRLGALGFLSLNNPKLLVPGNAGLKDQVLALKWIKSNVAAFGGDPNNITIFGESAGACSVHYHLLSDMSKNLFNKAISMSGTALNNWSINKNRNWPERLAIEIGWNGIRDDDDEFENEKNVLDYLRSVTVAQLLKAQDKLLTADERKQFILFPFGPIIEPYKSEQYFIPKSPVEMCRNAWSSNEIPYIVGGCSEEGLLLYRIIIKKSYLLSKLAGFEGIVPIELELDMHSDKCKEIGALIKRFYFDNSEPSLDTLTNYIELISDKLFWHGISRAVQSRLTAVNAAPTYIYRFSYESKSNFNHAKLFFAGRNVAGACHSDDCSYIFKNALSGKINENSKEYEIMEKMVDFWTNFAATGNPNGTDDNSKKDNHQWEPVSNPKPYKCMDINDEIKCIELPESKRLAFWDSIYTGIKDLI